MWLPVRLRFSSEERCVTKVERRRAVRFLAADRTRLIGLELGSGRRGLVLAHGQRQSLCVWIRHGRQYAAPGTGCSSSTIATTARRPTPRKRYWRIDSDVVGAIRTLRNRGAKTVVLAGSSMGGAAVLVGAAAAQPAVDGVVGLSAHDEHLLGELAGSRSAPARTDALHRRGRRTIRSTSTRRRSSTPRIAGRSGWRSCPARLRTALHAPSRRFGRSSTSACASIRTPVRRRAS